MVTPSLPKTDGGGGSTGCGGTMCKP